MTKNLKTLLNKIPQRKKFSLPTSLRSRHDELAYTLAKKSGKSRPLIEEPRLREWSYWALIDNKFPYSAAFKVSHMLIPKREVGEKFLTANEKNELLTILDELDERYDCQLVNFKKRQSKLRHYHIHLLSYKDNREDMYF